MREIKFSHNWNRKLDNEYFTTIRKATEENYERYYFQVGKLFHVKLGDKTVCKARLIDVYECRFYNIPSSLLIVDTGTESYRDVFKKFGIEGTDDVIILTFKKEAVRE